MTRKHQTTNQNAMSAPMFKEGDRVTVTTAATGNEPLTGTITGKTQTGWFVVQLDTPIDHPTCKDGKVSARAGSMKWAPQNQALSTPAPAPVPEAAPAPADPAPAPDAAPATHPLDPLAYTVCPVCGSSRLYNGRNDEGMVVDDDRIVGCYDCDWEFEMVKARSVMAKTLSEARPRYTKTHRPDGTPSADCADAIARELREYEPMDVCTLADRVCGLAHGTCLSKYGHLNNGQIRMNSGNRIRAYWKRINEEGNESEIKRVSGLLGLDAWDRSETGEE